MRFPLPTLLLMAACSGAGQRQPSAAAIDSASTRPIGRASAQPDTDAIFFGVFDPASREYGADPLVGRLTGTGWQPDSIVSEGGFARILGHFLPGDTLPGIDSIGGTVSVVIDSLPNSMGEAEGSIAAHLTTPGWRKIGPVLFSTRSLRPIVVRALPQQITPEIAARVQRAADSIFSLALPEAEDIDKLATIRLRDLRVFTVPGADSLLFARAGADIIWPNQQEPDDRGSIFIALSRAALRVQYGSFGHPEWSPNSKRVRVINPVAYFSLLGNSRVLLFADYQGPWESNSFAILDLATGRPLAVQQ